MTTYATAAEAIARSVSHDEIAHAHPAAEADLLMLSDDYAESGGVTEYWGTDDSDRRWRVHVPGGSVERALDALGGRGA